MNNIGYQSWQAIIRLPYLILLAFYVDQRYQIRASQLAAFVDLLSNASVKNQGRSLSMVCQDASAEIPRIWGSTDYIDFESYIGSCAISVEAARKSLNREEFSSYCDFMYQLIRKTIQPAPWYKQFLLRLCSGSAKKKTNFVANIASYLEDVIEESNGNLAE